MACSGLKPISASGQRVGIGAEEQMAVVGLDSLLQHYPVTLSRHLKDELLQSVTHETDQHLPAPLRAPDA